MFFSVCIIFLFVWFVNTAGCYSDSCSIDEVYEDGRPHTSHESRSYLRQADRSLSAKGSHTCQNDNSVTRGSGRPRTMCTKAGLDLQCLSHIPSENAKSDKLSEAHQVYAELQDISNKLKVKITLLVFCPVITLINYVLALCNWNDGSNVC